MVTSEQQGSSQQSSNDTYQRSQCRISSVLHSWNASFFCLYFAQPQYLCILETDRTTKDACVPKRNEQIQSWYSQVFEKQSPFFVMSFHHHFGFYWDSLNRYQILVSNLDRERIDWGFWLSCNDFFFLCAKYFSWPLLSIGLIHITASFQYLTESTLLMSVKDLLGIPGALPTVMCSYHCV